MTATIRELDFDLIDEEHDPLPIRPIRSRTGAVRSTSKKQLRARARRSRKGPRSEEFQALYKPIEEWDPEELARGRVRDKNGSFSGRPPTWLTRELHEEAMTRFKQVIKDGMNAETNTALDVIHQIMTDDSLDDKGKPLTPASTKLQAAQFLLEHAVGKPTQRQETDISVRLQGVLATSIITPGSLPAFANSKALASPRSEEDSIVDAEWVDDDDEGEDE